MKNTVLKIAIGLSLTFALPVYAINITVPSATGSNYFLVSTSTGAYITIGSSTVRSTLGLGTAALFASTDFLASSTSYVATTTGNWPGTWQGVSSSTFYLASNPSSYTTTTVQSVLNSISGTAPISFSTSTGAISFVNPGYITSSTGAAYFAASTTVSSQWTTTSTGIFYNGGRVGIGVFSPSYALDVNGTANVSSSTRLLNLNITGTAGSGFITLPSQSSNPTAPPAGSVLLHAVTTNGITRVEQDNEASTNLVYSRDNIFIAKNETGATITKGSVVYTSGVVSGVPQITKARANSATTLPALGVVMDDIAHLAFGQVMTLGIVTMDTSAFSDGQSVWVSATTAGALTATRPSGTTNFVQRAGSILVSGVSGSMLVDMAPAVLNMETGTNAATWTGSAIVGNSITNTSVTSSVVSANASGTLIANTAVSSSSISFNVYDATTTAPYNYAKWRTSVALTVSEISCDEYGGGTTTMIVYRATALATTSINSKITSSTILCGSAGTTTNTFTTSSLSAGDFLFVNTTSTAATSTWTTVNVYFKKN